MEELSTNIKHDRIKADKQFTTSKINGTLKLKIEDDEMMGIEVG